MSKEIDEFHKHELLDRIHSINVMFDQLVVGHPAAVLMGEDVKKAESMLADLYSKAGRVRLDL